MRSFWWQFCISRSRRQMTAVLLLMAVTFALLPVPLFSFRPNDGKDHSRPFPCQDRPCGCRSAEQCKKKCCCFSSEQKLAWAKRHGVKVSDVVSSDDLAALATTKSTPATKPHKCCSAHNAPKARADDINPSRTPVKALAQHYKFVIGVIAQECQGSAQTATGQSVFVVPPLVSLERQVETIAERIVLQGSRFVQRETEPPVPPPRQFAV